MSLADLQTDLSAIIHDGIDKARMQEREHFLKIIGIIRVLIDKIPPHELLDLIEETLKK